MLWVALAALVLVVSPWPRALPRARARIHAAVFGYFWLPCPVCGEMFGGHEQPSGAVWDDSGRGRVTCPACAEEHPITGLRVRMTP